MEKDKSAGRRSGQSILEVIIALAIFALFAASMVSLALGGFTSLIKSDEYLTAAALADEGLEAARAIRDGAWNELVYNQSAVSSSTGAWRFLGEGTSETIGSFQRVITFTPLDLYRQEVTAKVNWLTTPGGAAEVTRATYLTDWDSRDWVQTDWSGGDYTSVDPTVETTTAGQLKLKQLPAVWSLFADTGNQTWNDVWLFSATDGFVVGAGGQIRRFDGSAWNNISSGTTQNLNAIYCLSASNCSAVGGSGTILRWNGIIWSLHQDTGNQTWNDVWLFSATNGLVVGASGQTGRLAGSTWSTTQVGTTNWNGLYCLAVNDCYAPGAAGRIGRWNGSSWSVPARWDTGNQTWNDIWMFSAADGLVIGASGNVQRWDGTSWNAIAGGSGTTQNLNAIYCLSASNCSAVGRSGTIIQWNGAAWSVYAPAATTQNLFTVFFLAATDGWATGASGNILRFSGGGFELTGALTSAVFDLGDPSPVQIIEWDEQIPVCIPAAACNIKFQIRVSDNPAMAGASWSPDFTAAAGELIPISYNGRRYAQYQVFLNGDGANTPVLDEVRINYK